VDDRAARARRPVDRSFEGALGGADRAGVGRVVEEERRRGRGCVEVGRPAGVGIERDRADRRSRQRRAGGIVRIVRVGEQDRVALVGQRERELDDPGLRAGDERDLALGVELDPVHGAVAVGDRLLQACEPANGRVAVYALVEGGRAKRLDDMLGWADVRVAAAQVDERRPRFRGSRRDALDQRDEVLLRQPVEP
jgi:hypothetical protein